MGIDRSCWISWLDRYGWISIILRETYDFAELVGQILSHTPPETRNEDEISVWSGVTQPQIDGCAYVEKSHEDET